MKRQISGVQDAAAIPLLKMAVLDDQIANFDIAAGLDVQQVGGCLAWLRWVADTFRRHRLSMHP